MEIVANWTINKEYLDSYWQDWISSRSKGRKWSLPLASFFIIIGLMSLILVTKTNAPFAFLIMGFTLLTWHFWEKHSWYKNRINSKSFGTENIIRFTPDIIYIKGVNSQGEMSWNAIEDITISTNGLFLVIQKAISIYIPVKAVKEFGDLERIEKLYRES